MATGTGTEMGTSSSHAEAVNMPTFYAGEGSGADPYASPPHLIQMYDFFAGSSSKSPDHLQQYSLPSTSGPSSSSMQPFNVDYSTMLTENFIYQQQLEREIRMKKQENLMALHQLQDMSTRAGLQLAYLEEAEKVRQSQNLGASSSHSHSESHFPMPMALSMVPPGGYPIMQTGGSSSSSSGFVPHFPSSAGMGLYPFYPIDLDSQVGTSQAGPSRGHRHQSYPPAEILTKDQNTEGIILPINKPPWACGMSDDQLAIVFQTATREWMPNERLDVKVRTLANLSGFLEQHPHFIPLLAQGNKHWGLQVALKCNPDENGHGSSRLLRPWQAVLERHERPSLLNRIYYYILERMGDPTFEEQYKSLRLFDQYVESLNEHESHFVLENLKAFNTNLLDGIIKCIREAKRTV